MYIETVLFFLTTDLENLLVKSSHWLSFTQQNQTLEIVIS